MAKQALDVTGRLQAGSGSAITRLLRGIVLSFAAFAWAIPARPQTAYPTRPIQLVVTVPPGGAADFVARIISAKLADAVGQPLIVANRGGAAGTIAAAGVAKSDPDGYTLLLNTIATHGIGPHLYANLPYDPTRGFAPVILIAKLPLIMTVTAMLPAQSVTEVIALAKAQPGQLAFASAGTGGAPHLAGELFKIAAGIDLLHVPYRGSGPAVVDLIAGRVAIMFDAAPSLLPFIISRQLRPLAAASRQRHRLLPQVPSFAELGYDRMDISLWYGVVAPAGTPQAIVQRLNAELAKILEMADVRKSFADQGADVEGGTPAAFDAFMREESARWGAVVKQAGIQPE
ncbi:MAG TPA: tripartite tricarboxylate transporter substrate binding protein [Xanthobacteraceae bacterium]|nr:tripartite tricarboxylate transporter substrate binding protein [Xanthobacteraceae bacterium]